MRVFLAIEFTEEVKEYLYKIQQIVKNHSSAGNFTSKENFHLTLRFIGEVKEHELNKLKEIINYISLNREIFQIVFKELGEFPRKNKKIIWIGLQQNKELDLLYSNLEDRLEFYEYPKEERRFVPHITLGREIILTEEFNNIKNSIEIDKVKMTVNKISIMESTRKNGQLTYIPIYVKQFKSKC
ncbi:RNA 2',3'-cyclic phosphodiesterase [Tissierella sp. P1]|uniref:RNA 2',3'-cyclic phosphodiesterase n=1 Tax=unclassified Tissierella TaxID=2638726 RepID=UPI000BA14C75|nr:RNA 2',3'-cyclic phosphodiesterase [Tissierella sp. P1]MDU5083436.1 RNA 2',3'-cyclic phosphodiesterase [Bacillota bacterium]OZV10723.1 RNA 2',3'-cyclic phosphodiesterase [Tissierella sp. P1]